MTIKKELNNIDKDRIIEMAWEDRTTFDAILMQFGLKERVSTALELIEGRIRGNEELVGLQLHDALEQAQTKVHTHKILNTETNKEIL